MTAYAVIVGHHPVCSKACYDAIAKGGKCKPGAGCCNCGKAL